MKTLDTQQSMTDSSQYIILGAGAPHYGDTPAALREARSGMPVLEWVLDALRASPEEVTFVAGYNAEAIRKRYPGLKVLENQDWQETGSALSLLNATFEADRPLIVCYGDILFRGRHVLGLEQLESPVAVAWDSAWQRRYAGRTKEDLDRCEKLTVAADKVVRLGSDIPVDWASGEFIGLVRFSPEAVVKILELKKQIPASLQKLHLSGLLEYLRSKGLEIRGKDVRGDWAEVNAPQDIAHFVLGTKADTLKRLRGMVSKAVIQDQITFQVHEWDKDKAALTSHIRAGFAGQKVVVRSSARSEDTFSSANAGAYTSVLGVDPDNGLEDAIDRVLASYKTGLPEDQVLIQPMLSDVVLSGVAFTRTLKQGSPWYVINYETSGSTDGITSGGSKNHQALMLRRNVSVQTLPEPRLAHVLDALREIESLLGYDALDVEFAVDSKGKAYILQVRPIAVDHPDAGINDDQCNKAIEQARFCWNRLKACPPHIPGNVRPLYGVMPDWNPAEIIGTSPGALAESLYRYLVMDETWATQRAEYGYRDVRPGPLLVSFAGRPYVDVRFSFASFIPASVPDDLAGRLLGFYLDWLSTYPEFHDKVEFEVVPTCLDPGFGAWEERLCKMGGFSKQEVAILRSGLKTVTANALVRSEQDLDKIRLLDKRFQAIKSASDLNSLERARILLDDCRRLGTLPFAHLARSAFVAVTMLRGALKVGAISQKGKESFLSTVKTISHALSADARDAATGKLAWEEFVDRYGHLRPGTYEITSPRYDSNPEHFLRPLLDHAMSAQEKEENNEEWRFQRKDFFKTVSSLGLGIDGFESFMRQAIEGREYAKFVFSRNLSLALEDLALTGEELGLSRHELADVPLDSIFALRGSSHPGQDQVKILKELAGAGQAARKISTLCELPPLITSEKDLDVFIIGSDQPNFIGSQKVIADCIPLSGQNLDDKLEVAGKIVLIPQADPGYDWLFAQGIVGLITMYGGANSHMAIRAAEFGMPAAIGVGEKMYQSLTTACVLELDPGSSIIRVIR